MIQTILKRILLFYLGIRLIDHIIQASQIAAFGSSLVLSYTSEKAFYHICSSAFLKIYILCKYVFRIWYFVFPVSEESFSHI